MKIIIGVEFDVESDEISDVLQPIEAVAYGLGCEQIMVYQRSGANLAIGGRGIFPPGVFCTVKREVEDGKEDD